MRMLGKRSDRVRSLRRIWSLTVGRLAGLLVAITAVAVGLSWYQQSTYVDRLAGLEEETVATAALERAVLEATGPMSVVLYRIGDDADVEQAWTEYEQASAAVDEAFVTARASLHSDAERGSLDEARQHWETIDPAVRNAASEYGDEELTGLLARGEDPFADTVWGSFDGIDRALVDVRMDMVADMRATAAHAENVQQRMIAIMLAALGFALASAYLAVRRMRRRVLEPLEEIVRGARAMSEHTAAPDMDVRGAVREVRDVARVLTETAVSLDVTHGMLQERAITDPLTGLPNRTAFHARLEIMADEPAIRRVGVMFIDLDDFKDVNDTLGHAAGDELLRIVSLRLQAATRGCEMVARLGGDEFAVALRLGSDADGAIIVAQRILATMEQPVHLDGVAAKVGCSIGIAVADADTSPEEVPTLLANADFAMYMAKSQGKNCYEVHSPAMHLESLARTELRRDLTAALDRDEFELYYQPVMDLDTEDLLGFEALIRWHHPTHGLVPPGEFISLAEEIGVIVDIGAWVLDTACGQLAELHERDPSLMMSVNVAPQQLGEADFVRTVLNAALVNALPPDRLVLEITESTAMASAAAGAQVLDELRAHGVHIALDDFGTGFSSLRHLGDLPADILKIDRSFVTADGADEESMLESIITLARRLGLQVVAEGIEARGDLDRLRGYGRVAGQGYLFAHPMPAAALAAYRPVGVD